MTAKKTTNTKGKNTSQNRNQNKKNSKKKAETSGFSLKEEIVLWLMLALSVLILISNLGFGGFLGTMVSQFCIGLFGFPAYLFPILLFLAAAFLISNKGNPAAIIKTVGAVLLWLCLCTIFELFNGFDESLGILDYYKNSVEYRNGGGLLGGVLCCLLCPAIGYAGTWVVVLVIAVIAIVLVTGRSMLANVKKGSEQVYRTAQKDAKLRRERAQIRREESELRRERALMESRSQLEKEKERLEESRQLRREHRVSGVSFDTTVGGEIPKTLQKEEKPVLTPVEPVPEPVPEPIVSTSLPEFKINRAEDIYEEEQLYEEEMPIEAAAAPKESEKQEEPAMQAEAAAQPVGEEKAEHTGKNPRSSAKEQQKEMENVANEIAQQEKIQKPEYVFPPLNLLTKPQRGRTGDSNEVLRSTAQKLQDTLHSFGVEVHVTNVSCGPSVTRYELTPEQGVKVSRIVNLADDIKLNLAAADIRIEAPIPGKAAVGIEVPNKENSSVFLRELLETREFKEHPSNLVFAAGKDLSGRVVVADIAKMPHLLIAGATGSGKSVCINTIIMSLIYKAKPEDVKLIMIDPKVVELSVYNGIPHLFIPVVTDPKKAAGALNWAVAEMTDRYQKFAEYNVRDLKGYNQKIESIADIEDENKPEKLPQIVIIVDELADLMMVAPGEVEDAICRLAQLARAAGIHLIIATQRPSVNVITGLIKANMPSRIAFAVSSGVDSRTIIDMNGAEKLLGKGDMLFYPQGYQKPARVQGTFVSDKEVSDVVAFLTEKNNMAEYNQEMEEKISKVQQAAAEVSSGGGDVDEYFAQAGKFIIEKDKASIGMLQRMFKIGFNRAARIMDQLSDAGVVGPEEGTKPRKVLMSMEQFENYLEQN